MLLSATGDPNCAVAWGHIYHYAGVIWGLGWGTIRVPTGTQHWGHDHLTGRRNCHVMPTFDLH
jgi:hypothetical protein